MKRLSPIALSIALLFSAGHASAEDERQSLEMLRETTLNLIDALVESGVLTREKADALLSQAQARAERKRAEAQADDTIRVTYVPETVRNQIRDELKQEVLAQAVEEGWAAPRAVPGWVNRIKFTGDVRLRYQTDRYAQDNTPAADYVLAAQSGSTRAADFSTVDSFGLPSTDTASDVNRWRVRARLGVLAQISSGVSAGLRLATGNTGDRVSTNQTLGQNLNKYTFVVDQAYVRLAPTDALTLTGGRIPNPWLSTDLMWDSDLNFEGVAATWTYPHPAARFRPFATVGYFPIQAEDPPSNPDGRSLIGAQIGAAWDFSPMNRLRFGLAMYDFRDFEGRREPNSAIDVVGATEFVTASDYGSSQYEHGLRQKGNTLFATNALNDTTQPFYMGLASRFRPLNLTGVWDLGYWDPVHVLLSADYVINTAFDRAEIRRRTGLDMGDASANAWRIGIAVGQPDIREQGDWNASFVYKRIGSDALLDAFTDSDFGQGGTNLKGFVLGFAYGLDQRTSLGLKYFSADSIASPTLVDGDSFGVDTLQLDLAVKF
jgi:polyhydroxyalkanoate synthesis regulator phasin